MNLARIVLLGRALVRPQIFLNQVKLTCAIHHSTVDHCQRKNNRERSSKSSLTARDNGGKEDKVSVSVGEKVVHGTKLVFYLSVFGGGLVVLGAIIYTVCQELFSSSSPSKIQGKAHNLIKEDIRVNDLLGKPIKSYGSQTWGRRGRHQPSYETTQRNDGTIQMNMAFRLVGPRGRATAYVEVDDYGKGNHITSVIVQSDLGIRQTIKVL